MWTSNGIVIEENLIKVKGIVVQIKVEVHMNEEEIFLVNFVSNDSG